MCFDISSTKIKQLVAKNQKKIFYKEFDYQPFYHINGFSNPEISIIKMNESNIIYPSTWGFIPDWGEEDPASFRKKYNTLNAKSETLLSSKMFQENALEKRCIIIADGFFEPHLSFGNKLPYFCYMPSTTFVDGRDLFVFAGVYSELNAVNSTCSIITREANNFFSEVHNLKKRMPLVLDDSIIKDWLNPDLNKNRIRSILKEGFTKKEFKAHSVSKKIYLKKENTNYPEILNVVAYPNLFS